jgi:c-di-GMP-binding flagellar brake protein YcgR
VFKVVALPADNLFAASFSSDNTFHRVLLSAMRDPRRAALETLIRDYADVGARSRMGLLVSPGDGRNNYTVDVVGIIRQKRLLVLTAPTTEDGSLIAVIKGQAMTCRWFSATTAFHFRAVITRILFEPVPLVHIELPHVIERRTVRGEPRALATLRAVLKDKQDIETVFVDLSVGGARIAVTDEVSLSKGQVIDLHTRPRLLQHDYELQLRCQITGTAGNNDPKHPHVRFYGLNFENLSDMDRLVLHSYVQQCLAFESDVLSQVLLASSKEVDNAG